MQSMHAFRIDDDQWHLFLRACGNRSASATLREFVRWYNNGCRDQLKIIPPLLFPPPPPAAKVKDMAEGHFPERGVTQSLGGD